MKDQSDTEGLMILHVPLAGDVKVDDLPVSVLHSLY